MDGVTTNKLTDVLQKYKVRMGGKLDAIIECDFSDKRFNSNAIACTDGSTLYLNTVKINNIADCYKNNKIDKNTLMTEKQKIERAFTMFPSLSNNIDIQERLAEIKDMLRYSRKVAIIEGHEAKCVFEHEIAHILSEQKAGLITGHGGDSKKRLKIINTFEQSLRNGDIYKISKYASRNVQEFFAECFVAFTEGEDIPIPIKQILEVL